MQSNQIDKNDIKVTAILLTYNHAPYVKQTLESMVNQRTDFKFEIIVHDDASTDGTQEILEGIAKKNPKKIKLILEKENKYQKNIDFVTEIVLPKINGFYVAFCEGDDYWESFDMLQKEYDFLIGHPGYSAVGGITEYFDDKGRKVLKDLPIRKYHNREIKKETFYKDQNATVATSTYLFKKEVLFNDRYIEARKKSPKIGDVLLEATMHELGRVYVIGNKFQYHRVQSRSNASNYNSLFSYEQKYRDAINAINVIYESICHDKMVGRKLRKHSFLFFGYCALNMNIKKFIDCYKTINKEIR